MEDNIVYTVSSPVALEELNDRESPGSNIMIDTHLERYFSLLSYERAKLATLFTWEENVLMLNVATGTMFPSDAQHIVCFRDSLVDAIFLENMNEFYGVDKEKFLAKISKLDLLSLVAIVDAIERWFALAFDNPKFDPGGLFAI